MQRCFTIKGVYCLDGIFRHFAVDEEGIAYFNGRRHSYVIELVKTEDAGLVGTVSYEMAKFHLPAGAVLCPPVDSPQVNNDPMPITPEERERFLRAGKPGELVTVYILTCATCFTQLVFSQAERERDVIAAARLSGWTLPKGKEAQWRCLNCKRHHKRQL